MALGLQSTAGELRIYTLPDVTTPDTLVTPSSNTAHAALEWPFYLVSSGALRFLFYFFLFLFLFKIWFVFEATTNVVDLFDVESSQTLASATLAAEGAESAFDGDSLTGVVGLSGGGAALLWLYNDTTLTVDAVPGASTPYSQSFGVHVATAHGNAFVSDASDSSVYVSAHDATNGWTSLQKIDSPCPTSGTFVGTLAASATARMLAIGCSNGVSVLRSTDATPSWAAAHFVSQAADNSFVAVSSNATIIVIAADTAVRVFAYDGADFVLAGAVTGTTGVLGVAVDEISSHEALVAVLYSGSTVVHKLTVTTPQTSSNSNAVSESSSDGEEPENKWMTLYIPLIGGIVGGLLLIGAIALIIYCACSHSKKPKNDMLFADIATDDHHMDTA